MTVSVHPTALVDPSAELGEGTVVGPFAIVGPDVVTGPGCRLDARVSLERYVRLGAEVRVGVGSVLGGPPQDLKFKGEETWVEVGDGTVLREYCTVNRGTVATGRTVVGPHCFLMSYVHVAHDCHLAERVVIANGTQIAGHVSIHDHASLSGLVAVHQFVTIGSYAFVGGCTRVNQDIPPYVKAVGNPMELFGLNSIGLQRNGFAPETISALKRCYRLFFNSDLNLSQALERARLDLPPAPEVERFVQFVESSGRGVPA
ncbi:MAG TPA: acyl-ACP--UDP-N-acetylglucosamine O-acyltransferase [Gemmatimonadales bacterium]|nr:acyl-ACP--UDP-N-acetylglucosamine O-acyltransferase [Gemmatimonadales bacterium]